MPRYRPATCSRREKNASQTCICGRVVAGSCLKTSPILDQGSIDTCSPEVHTSKLQSIHCGLPASWTRARRHPPSSPSPVASRGGGRGSVFLNWTRVKLELPLVRREASRMGVHAQISSEADLLNNASTHSSSSTENMVRMPGWIDAQPVTNRQFQEFVNATRHITFAEIPPDPDDYPGTLPHMLFAGSLVFTPPKHRVDLRDW